MFWPQIRMFTWWVEHRILSKRDAFHHDEMLKNVQQRLICVCVSLVYKYIFLYSDVYPTRCNVTQVILSGNCSTCFGWCHHLPSGAQTTVSAAYGIFYTDIAICRYRGRVGTGLSFWNHSLSISNCGYHLLAMTLSGRPTIGSIFHNTRCGIPENTLINASILSLASVSARIKDPRLQ